MPHRPMLHGLEPRASAEGLSLGRRVNNVYGEEKMKTGSWIAVIMVAIQGLGVSGCLDIYAGNDNHSVCEAGDCWNTKTPQTCQTRKTTACAVQADCFSDMCTASECVDGACVHALRPDGLTCIGTHPPKDTFFGSCLCGACVEFDQ